LLARDLRSPDLITTNPFGRPEDHFRMIAEEIDILTDFALRFPGEAKELEVLIEGYAAFREEVRKATTNSPLARSGLA
jgi:hypothetical protein